MTSRAGATEPFAGRLATAAAKALSADAAALWLPGEAGSDLILAAGHGLPPSTAASASSLSHPEALAAGYVSIADAARDPQAALVPAGFLAALCVPLRRADETSQPGGISLGSLCVYSRAPRVFTQAEVGVLQAVAELGAAHFRVVSPTLLDERASQAQGDAEAERSRLARVTTHQLRSPITVAQSLLRNVVKGYAGPLTAQQRDVLDRIAGQLEYLSNLVNDFLDLAASKAPQIAGQEGPVVLNLSLARVVLVLQPRAEEKEIALVLHLCREELLVWASEEGLDHIFHNLVENAIKYTPPGGQVTVSMARAGEELGTAASSEAGAAQVMVTDTGIGIPDEARAHLFEEFYRAPNARIYNAVGTGLGLAIVKGLVDRYGGRIAVQSAGGQGTTFTVWIPLHRPAPSKSV
jgi:signal transduction histidine kinase